MTKKKRKHKPPDFGADLEQLIDERDAAEAEASRLWAEWWEKYAPEVEELIRYGEERKHGWAVGRTGVYSPRTQEEQAAGPPTREDVMLLAFYGMADEQIRIMELGHEAERLNRRIKETWEDARLFGMPGVINLKDRPRPDASDYVYIVGRALLAGKERFVRSKWANPHSVKRYGRGPEEVRAGCSRRPPVGRTSRAGGEDPSVLVQARDVPRRRAVAARRGAQALSSPHCVV